MGVLTINGETSLRGIRPLSNFWTYFRVSSEAKILTNTNDNEEVSDDNVRYHVNSCISYIADLLLLASSPWYGTVMKASIETSLHDTGLPYIDLTGAASGNPSFIDVSRALHKIERVSVPKVAGGASTQFKGNCVKWDLTKLTQQANNMNNQHSQTIAWEHYGDKIYLFIGQDINSPASSSGVYTLPDNFTIFSYRQPLLDDLLPPVTSDTYIQRTSTEMVNANVSEYVDLPDRYIKLLIDMVQALILQQLQRPIPNQLEQSVNQGVLQLTQMLSEEKRNAAEDRMKVAYGQQKFPFYAGAPGQG